MQGVGVCERDLAAGTERIIEDEEKVRELSNFASDGGLQLLEQELVSIDKTLTVAAGTSRLLASS